MKRIAVLLTLLLLSTAAHAQGLTNWIQQRRIAVLVARAEQNDVTVKQTESPATASGSSSLVDQSSTADLVSAALNFAGVGGGDAETGDGAKTISFTAYSLLAAAGGFDPLDPVRYNANRSWRRLSFTAGTSDKESVYALKYTFINRRDAQNLTNLQPLLDAVSQNVGDVSNLVTRYILTTPDVIERLSNQPNMREDVKLLAVATWGPQGNLIPPTGDVNAIQRFQNAQVNVLRALNDERVLDAIFEADNLQEIDDIIEASSASFEALQKATDKVIENINAKPQLALTATHKQVADAADGFVAELVYDQGMPGTNMLITANAGYQRTEGDTTAAIDFFRFAGQLRIPLGGAGSRRFLDFAAEANNKNDEDVFKVQAKLTLPITTGIDFPLSITWANRSDLIDEKEIRGLIGFTLDYAQLLKALRK